MRVFRSALYKDILVTFPLDKKNIEAIINLENNKKNKFHFLIENEVQYMEASKIIENFKLDNVNIVPIYTKYNNDFFESNIYLEKEDIFSVVINMRKIFCNQKLNANNFGILNILPNGIVKANANSKELGNIYEQSILDLLYKEIINNTAWRKIRNKGSCYECLYKFLCPPPSNYEQVIGKPNLCHVR
jgi:pseudo-rSAM protein